MSKNAVLAHYFLPNFWTRNNCAKHPVVDAFRTIMRGPKIGQRKFTNLDSLGQKIGIKSALDVETRLCAAKSESVN